MRLIETDDFGTEVHIGDQLVAFDDARASVLDRLGDVFLIFLATGGNACPGYFAWLNTSAGNVSATEPFGTCSDLYEIIFDENTLSLQVQSMEPGEGDHLYVWDGVNPVTESILDLAPSDTPPGADPQGWLGRHPAELLDSSDWAELMLNVMTEDELAQVRHAMDLSSGFERQGEWIAAYGYQKLDEDVAAIAIHPRGELLVALGAVGQESVLWGETELDHPEAIAQVLSGY